MPVGTSGLRKTATAKLPISDLLRKVRTVRTGHPDKLPRYRLPSDQQIAPAFE